MPVRGHGFFGRERELEVLRNALGGARRGRGGVVLVVGEPGIGKTALAEHIATSAERDGVRVAWARAWDGGGAPPYWAAVQVIRGLGGASSPVIAALGRDDAIEAHTRFEIQEAFAELLQSASEEKPVLVLLDDLHAVEAGTIDLVRFVVRARPTARLAFVATVRSTDVSLDEARRRALGELARDSTMIALGGLDRAALTAWIAAVHREPDNDDDREWVEQVHRITVGNPLLIEAVLASGRASHVSSMEARAAVAARVGRLGNDAARVLDAMAVVGRPVSIAMLTRICGAAPSGIEAARVLPAVAEAIAAAVVDEDPQLETLRLHHPLVGDVVYAWLDPQTRAGLHLACATAFEQASPNERGSQLVHELAHHHAQAAPLGSASRAIELGWRAAEAAIAVADHDTAARRLQGACAALGHLGAGEASPVPADRLLAACGEAELAAGHLLRAREAFVALADLARTRGPIDALGLAALGVARTFEFAIEEPQRLALLEEAVRLVPSPSAMASRVRARLAQELWVDARAQARRHALADEAVAMAAALGDSDAEAFARNAWLQTAWDPADLEHRRRHTAALTELAQRSGNLERQLEAHRWRLNLAVEDGDLAAMHEEVASYTSVAEQIRRPDVLANAVMRQAMLPQLAADHALGLALALRTRELQRRAGDPQAEVVYDSRRAMLAVLGEVPTPLAPLVAAMRRHVVARPGVALYRAIFVQALVADGQLDEAREQWETLWRRGLADLDHGVMWLSSLVLLVASCVALGDLRRAQTLYDRLAPLGDRHAAIGASFSLGATSHHLGALAELLGRSSDAIAHYRDAAARNEAMGARGWAERSRAALARLRSDCDTAPPKMTTGVMANEGASWRIELAGDTVRVAASRGLAYLRVLLERPGTQVHVLELLGTQGGVPSEGDTGPMLDARGKAQVRGRVEALREELDEAERHGDYVRAERARGELEALSTELARAFGLGGRARATGSAAERARVSVTKALGRAIERLAADLPGLAAHLQRAVRTGLFCAYDPDPGAAIEWTFPDVTT